MKAIDTNVAIRLITKDDPLQLARAVALVKESACLLVPTVLLEVAWVLRSGFAHSDPQAARELRLLIDTPNIVVDDPLAVRQALDDAEAGMDLADAFHRAFASGAERLVTFDQRFVASATGREGVPVESL